LDEWGKVGAGGGEEEQELKPEIFHGAHHRDQSCIGDVAIEVHADQVHVQHPHALTLLGPFRGCVREGSGEEGERKKVCIPKHSQHTHTHTHTYTHAPRCTAAPDR
jgi:hypothetical protein